MHTGGMIKMHNIYPCSSLVYDEDKSESINGYDEHNFDDHLMTDDHVDDGFDDSNDENGDADYAEVTTQRRKPRKRKLKREYHQDDDSSAVKRKKPSGGHKRKMCDFCDYSTHRYRVYIFC